MNDIGITRYLNVPSGLFHFGILFFIVRQGSEMTNQHILIGVDNRALGRPPLPIAHSVDRHLHFGTCVNWKPQRQHCTQPKVG